MPASFFVVPQWQGSGSSRAMRLIDGAEAIRGDLPSMSTTVVDVPLGAGSDEGTAVQRLSSIVSVRDALAVALDGAVGLPITVGGDCGVELAAVSRAIATGTTAVVWLDAHPDLNTPEESPSGAFHGMVLRTLLGDGVEALVPSTPLLAEHLVLGGARASTTPNPLSSNPRASARSARTSSAPTRSPLRWRPPGRPRSICTSTWMCSIRPGWTASGFPSRSG